MDNIKSAILQAVCGWSTASTNAANNLNRISFNNPCRMIGKTLLRFHVTVMFKLPFYIRNAFDCPHSVVAIMTFKLLKKSVWDYVTNNAVDYCVLLLDWWSFFFLIEEYLLSEHSDIYTKLDTITKNFCRLLNDNFIHVFNILRV